jgi:hypothetical protein
MAALAAVSAAQKKDFEALKARLSAQLRPVLSLEDAVPTAIPDLDRLLGGGLPNGAVVTLEGATGRWSLAAALARRLTHCGLVAILDDGTLYPPGLAQAGVALERVLVVPARKALQIVRAVDILLRSRTCRLVVMPAITVRDRVWTRLAQLAHRSGVLLIVMAERAGASLSSIAELRLNCALEQYVMDGTRGLWGSFAGFELCVDVRKHKHMLAGGSAHIRVGKNAALR